MNNLTLIVAIVSIAVIIIMIKQINKLTSNIDAKQEQNQPMIYATFAAYIQDKIRLIKADIDRTKNTINPKYILKDEKDEESSLEFLADTIRKLIFFETMNSKRKSSKEIESELFGILSSLDDFLHVKIQNGEELAEDLRNELLNEFNKIQNN